MSIDLKNHLFKWTIFLAAITVAALLSSKFSEKTSPESEISSVLKVENHVNKLPVTVNNTPARIHVKTTPLNLTAEKDSTLFLNGTVKDENSEALVQSLFKMNTDVNSSKDPILLIIDSPGGSVFAGAKVLSAIEASKRPVYTICYGLCASMAAIIHQYGTKRSMVDRSVLMFHNASGGVEGEINQMLSQLNMINEYTHKMDAYIAKKSGMELNTFLSMCNSQIWIDADDSLGSFSDKTVSVNLSKLFKEQKGFLDTFKRDRNLKLIERLINVTD